MVMPFVTTHLEYCNVGNMGIFLEDHLGAATGLECGNTDSFDYFTALT